MSALVLLDSGSSQHKQTEKNLFWFNFSMSLYKTFSRSKKKGQTKLQKTRPDLDQMPENEPRPTLV